MDRLCAEGIILAVCSLKCPFRQSDPLKIVKAGESKCECFHIALSLMITSLPPVSFNFISCKIQTFCNLPICVRGFTWNKGLSCLALTSWSTTLHASIIKEASYSFILIHPVWSTGCEATPVHLGKNSWNPQVLAKGVLFVSHLRKTMCPILTVGERERKGKRKTGRK